MSQEPSNSPDVAPPPKQSKAEAETQVRDNIDWMLALAERFGLGAFFSGNDKDETAANVATEGVFGRIGTQKMSDSIHL
jgi:peptide subunit release factor 1 (eRF1)